MAVCQSIDVRLIHRYRGQAPSHMGVVVFGDQRVASAPW